MLLEETPGATKVNLITTSRIKSDVSSMTLMFSRRFINMLTDTNRQIIHLNETKLNLHKSFFKIIGLDAAHVMRGGCVQCFHQKM